MPEPIRTNPNVQTRDSFIQQHPLNHEVRAVRLPLGAALRTYQPLRKQIPICASDATYSIADSLATAGDPGHSALQPLYLNTLARKTTRMRLHFRSIGPICELYCTIHPGRGTQSPSQCRSRLKIQPAHKSGNIEIGLSLFVPFR